METQEAGSGSCGMSPQDAQMLLERLRQYIGALRAPPEVTRVFDGPAARRDRQRADELERIVLAFE